MVNLPCTCVIIDEDRMDTFVLLQNSETVCPVILPPSKQNYYVPVDIPVNLTLNSKNIPPPVSL